MKNENWIKGRVKTRISKRLKAFMKCLHSGEQLKSNEMISSSESLATRDYSASVHSTRAGNAEQEPDTGNIEEAESSLRENGSLNYEEARALLGRFEYQKGNIEAALHVFEGIDIAAITPKMKTTLGAKLETRKRRSHNTAIPPMSIHAVSLVLEAVFLKAKSLQILGRYKEAAQSCTVILDVVESSLPAGFPENFGADSKLQETLNNAVELLPELWKLVESPREAILSYRRALLFHWNLKAETVAKLQKEFATFLLYSGEEASPPTLRSQLDSSFVPKNNMEEAILLLMILLRKVSLRLIEWDPSILYHLQYALFLCEGGMALADQLEELLPGIIDRKEMYYTLALCYHGEGDDFSALNLLRKLLHSSEDPNHLPSLLMASKICSESGSYEDGTKFAFRAMEDLKGRCDQMAGVANSLLGISLAAQSRLALTDSERTKKQSEALQSLETAVRMTNLSNPSVVYHLSLEYAEQRKLVPALHYAKSLLRFEGGSNISGWLLVTRILSAQKRLDDAVTVVNAALEQTQKWDQGELFRLKAKVQIAQGKLKDAIETYTQLLAVLQIRTKSYGYEKKLHEDAANRSRSLELETWHDLAFVYISLSKWHDAEICLSKSKAIKIYSASRWHATGALNEAKGIHNEALKAFAIALDIDSTHVPSLVSKAVVLRRFGERSLPLVRSLLTEALRLDRMNYSAWYNLGLFYKDKGSEFALEAAECFEAASLLEDTAPVEPFR
ncbi:Tetratricopeptide repeat protein like [Heracleum sosnowskyi]|uniref:Tetratricopeptide repeat protein like n=1 Tax=Heracleum sosnowskyi TaxID=360622 RepID=A0AAD8GXL3_9APIA|nr:Tetratricopeptide repeat protein like [Heracleum sosnowskyi]